MPALDIETTTTPTVEPPRAPVAGVGAPPSRGRPPTSRPGRHRARRIRRGLAAALLVVGALLLADAAATLLWQEPLTSVYAHAQQAKLDRQLAELDHVSAGAAGSHAPVRSKDPQQTVAFAAHALARRIRDGGPVARLRIPRIGLSAVVVQGTGAGELRKGPGHYDASSLPGERGTVGIAGHRTTMGAWFRHIDRLEPGDRIEVAMPYGRFTYRVQDTRIVKPTALWITKRVGYDRLVLSACHPLFTASKRIVVFARLVATRPR